ncbi:MULTISPECIES: dihydrodipicolinate synthase family protein [Flavobacteriaceae]|uniref:dihydrodipicolinate synthase family protein n=1 Tax=Flavobacteriaceae TaxID=49546 RepID=UPI00149185D7|nr:MULTISPECIES: dihydrodipicolinate synthase family protein [Allomuricauda]MDC6366251.1 dihydrodipicolinate synthase family protein [Muricauda sp. AC10]
MNLLPDGLWPVMLTPFNDSNHVDVPNLHELTQFYLKTGASGLFANCLSSEMFQLNQEERLLIIKEVLASTDNKVPVIATGTFGGNLDRNADFSKQIFDLGVTAVVINSNQFCDEFGSEDGFKLKMEKFIKKTEGIPLGIYECPIPYKRKISPSLLKWLAGSGRFLYHKDTSCNIEEIAQKLKAVENSNLGFFNAHVPTGLESIKLGAKGLSPIGANMYPELFNHLLLKHREGDDDSAKKLDTLLSVMDKIIHQNYPYCAKYFLNKRGLNMNTQCRGPRAAMTKKDYLDIQLIMNMLMDISESFNIELYSFKICH